MWPTHTPKDYGLKTNHNVYVVAEIGINHGGDVDKAIQLIESAGQTGCDAVKFQTYLTEKRCSPEQKDVYAILKRCELPFAAFSKLKECADDHGLQFFSTPFDEESLECLESIGCELYKVASFDVVNRQLIDRLGKTRKPVIMSVGMASMEEIDAAFSILRASTDKIVLLNCTSAYPMPEDDANLGALHVLRKRYGCLVGYSDHSTGNIVSQYAVAAGSQVIERHYRIDESMECVDAPVSVTQEQMLELVQNIRRLETILGDGQLGVKAVEKDIIPFRRLTEPNA